MEKNIYLYLIFLLFTSCKYIKKETTPLEDTAISSIERPSFSSDSAYLFIQEQVNFGNRVPGTAPHTACKNYLVDKLSQYADTVLVQSTMVTLFDGKQVPCYNIVGSYNRSATKRLLLAAHWDTRPYADQDDKDKHKPIAGANDGGSGVGVLLEVARQLSLKNPSMGIDIIFFDVEDWGQPDFSMLPYKEDTYCLGSQYWSKNPHVMGYTAQQGILLDMVGGKGATFALEGTSMRYAPEFMRKVWIRAEELGYAQYFRQIESPPIVDDHFYVNTIANIPMIDIIHRDPATASGFPHYWHKHIDDMSSVDKASLQAVGETVLSVIYE